MIPQIEKIYVNPDSLNSPLTGKICSAYKNVPVITSQKKDIIDEITAISRDAIGYGKKILYLARNEGSFLKKCPGTKGVLCCNYYILNLATNCPLDCTYCILQEYLGNNPLVTIFTNIDDAFTELETEIGRNRNHPVRIGTGELADSLAFDTVTETSAELINFFREKKNAVFELKTKTSNIGNLISAKGERNIIIGWSLNPRHLIESDEKGSASLDERISAAAKCRENGFSISFHFDPIIRYDGWEDDYASLVKKLFTSADSSSIAWISLGALRFSKGMKEIIKERFPASDIIYNEFVICRDGKYRYIRPLREDLFSKMTAMIKQYAPHLPIYLCMEQDFIWQDVFSAYPSDIPELHSIFF